jgi:PAS domain S-box-containing protein
MHAPSAPGKERQEIAALKRNYLLAALLWSLFILAAYLWNAGHKEKEILELAHTQAESLILKDLSFRSWLASHGGVYVFPDAATPPNPYLKDYPRRDLTTTTGETLTLMNPAYVTRQLLELYTSRYGIRGHITSLDPLNPGNRPAPWEERALRTFEKGAKEASEVIEIDGVAHYALIRPLMVEKPCMKCHEKQGYKIGDVRGGLSAMIPLAPLEHSKQFSLRLMAITHGVIWLLVLTGIFWIYALAASRTRERLRILDQLEENRHLFQTVADFASEWIFWRNPDGSIRYVSPACEQVTGYPAEAFYANPELFNDIVHPDDRHHWLHHVHEADQNGHPRPLELRILTQQGETRYISHTCRPIFDDRNNRFLGVRGSNSDITAYHENQLILIQQSRMAAMGEMIGNIGHQWRQPLNALALLHHNIKDDFEYGELSRESLDKTLHDAKRLIDKMSATIDDFRNFFKPNKKAAAFSLNKSIEDALKLVHASFTEKQIEVTLDVAEEIQGHGYDNEFSQVLLNILSNAKDAILENDIAPGKIRISLGQDMKHAWVTLADNAGGIPPDALPHIFDPYFTTKEKGTGIGLYMSRMIMNHMGGSIEAANTAGGAEFRLTLPRPRNH